MLAKRLVGKETDQASLAPGKPILTDIAYRVNNVIPSLNYFPKQQGKQHDETLI